MIKLEDGDMWATLEGVNYEDKVNFKKHPENEAEATNGRTTAFAIKLKLKQDIKGSCRNIMNLDSSEFVFVFGGDSLVLANIFLRKGPTFELLLIYLIRKGPTLPKFTDLANFILFFLV